DGDGVPDSIERDEGTDPNDINDYQDTDGDGISDHIEDQNAHLDPAVFNEQPIDSNTDSDGNGVPNTLEQAFTLSGNDSDFDGIDDNYDVDQTGGVDANVDGIDDALLSDLDGNDIADIYDLDNDGDGIPDVLELGALSFPIELLDSDGDGTANYNDLDSDNDGASDLSESQVTTTFNGIKDVVDDDDSDGISNVFDIGYTGGQDTINQGIDDAVEVRDTDGDGVSDYVDLDSDNDGLLDVQEIGLNDINGDGFADPNQNIIDDLPDTDGDGTPDLRDLKSHSSGVFDIAGTLAELFDTDSDGAIDETADIDRDGIMDVVDGDLARFGSGLTGDTDGDGVLDHNDLDDDNDGILDIHEGHGDADNDGVIDRLDRDSDSDGIPDSQEGNADLDGDGVPNYLDTDTDGDGIPDNEEQMLVPPLGVDSDMDGIDDAYDVDVTGGIDGNSDGIDDDMLDLSDLDGDGLLNYQDTDSDGDGYLDEDENGDYNSDGIPDYKQIDPGFKTSTGSQGGGSLGGFSLFALLLLLIQRKSLHFSFLKGKVKSGLLFFFIIFSSSVVSAESICEPSEGFSIKNDCWYVGAGIGVSFLKPDGENTGWYHDEDENFGYRVQAGYYFSPKLFTELNYTSLGDAEVTHRNPAIPGEETISYNVLTMWLGYDVYTTDNNKWKFYVKGGIADVITKASSSRVVITEENDIHLSLGLGATYQINDRWFAQAELNSFTTDASYAGLSISRYFGKSKPRAVLGTTQKEDAQETETQEVEVAYELEFDYDGDGVHDMVDVCLETVDGLTVDETGCAEFQGEFSHLLFERGSYVVSRDNAKVLDDLVRAALDYKSLKIDILAHADSHGSHQVNLELSKKRADAIANYLKKNGVHERRYTVHYFGETAPIHSNETVEGRAKNRRVELVVASM
ncbi:MAG: OmpA family protein, partial [Sinobacterium sp.]|nr:OmpA family protein [Sinobacterium sp.]